MPDDTGTVERVTFNRRFFGSYWLEGLLFVLTLGVGWFVWLAFTAQMSQTPAKRLLNVYIIDTDTGQPVHPGRVWVRDIVVKQLVVAAFTFIIGLAWFIDGVWVLFDKNRQTLHDKVMNTVVVYAPAGLPEQLSAPVPIGAVRKASVSDLGEQLRELARLRDEGIITPEEYDRKRGELAGKL
ncbi:MAG: RDD family protein [Dehalococcoidia bacterium]|nr:RDD family protein [Dehalococcoidia bacterium]